MFLGLTELPSSTCHSMKLHLLAWHHPVNVFVSELPISTCHSMRLHLLAWHHPVNVFVSELPISTCHSMRLHLLAWRHPVNVFVTELPSSTCHSVRLHLLAWHHPVNAFLSCRTLQLHLLAWHHPMNVFWSYRTPQFHLSFSKVPPPGLTSSNKCFFVLQNSPVPPVTQWCSPPWPDIIQWMCFCLAELPSSTCHSARLAPLAWHHPMNVFLSCRTPQFHLSLSEARPPGLTCRTWSTSAWSRCLSAALRLVVECFSSRVSLQFHGPQPAISWRILCSSRNFPEFWWLQPTNVWQNRPHCLAHAVSQMAFGWLFHIV